jgi:hypothetical protein
MNAALWQINLGHVQVDVLGVTQLMALGRGRRVDVFGGANDVLGDAVDGVGRGRRVDGVGRGRRVDVFGGAAIGSLGRGRAERLVDSNEVVDESVLILCPDKDVKVVDEVVTSEDPEPFRVASGGVCR